MDGGAASIPSDPSPLMTQLRSMLSYAEDRDAKISIIKSILKRKQDHALPPDLQRDLLLEAKVRLGNEKKAARSKSAPSIPTATVSAATSLRSPTLLANDAEIRHTHLLNGTEISAHFSSASKPISGISAADSIRSGPSIESIAADSVRSSPRPSIAASAAEIRQTQILNAETDLGRILSDSEIAGLNVLKISTNKDGSGLPPRALAWSSLFSHPVGRARDLKFHSQPSTDPDHHIEFDDEDSLAAVQNWGNSLVGYFIGNTPPTLDIKLSLQKAWRIRDLEIIPMAEGFFLFKFAAYDIGQQILDEGPWFVYGHPLILKRWSADITMCRHNLESIPIWVRLPNLNFCFRSSSALSKIASVIGNPICMDHATAAGTRYAFARLCVEINVGAELPSELRMKYKEKTIIQKVEYAWKPNPCKTCCTFNHGDTSCPLKIDTSKPKKVWVPKKKQAAETPNDMTNETVHTQPLSHPTSDMHHVPELNQHISLEEEHHPNDPLKSTSAHGGWTVVQDKFPSGKPSSHTVNPKTNVSDSAPNAGLLLNQFSALSNLDGADGTSFVELAAPTPLILNTSSVGDTRPLPGKDMDFPTSASISSTMESHRFLSLSNLDGDSNVPESELLATTALVLQGNTAPSSQLKSADQQQSLFSIHQLNKGFLSKQAGSSSSARHKPNPAGITIKEFSNPKNPP